MKMHPVESSNIAAVGWQTDGTLTVAFRSGAVYRYTGVERGVYLALLKSESKGRAFWSLVRDKYDYERADTE